MIFLYMTKIINLENSYRKFTELLPEELLDPKSEEELRSNKSQLLKIIEEDLNFVKEKNREEWEKTYVSIGLKKQNTQ